jgi:hypothetical protein
VSGHHGANGWDLNDVSESQALWSLAVVLLALRWQPPMGWLARIRPLDATVTLLNNRAVTVYLWHNIAIAVTFPLLTLLVLDDLGRLNGPVELAAAIVLTAGAVLAFGWAEDLAARRRPHLWPARTRPSWRADEPADRAATGRWPARAGGPASGGPRAARRVTGRRAAGGEGTLPESVRRFASAPAPGPRPAEAGDPQRMPAHPRDE